MMHDFKIFLDGLAERSDHYENCTVVKKNRIFNKTLEIGIQ